MNDGKLQSSQSAQGTLGERCAQPCWHILDLNKRGDCALVERAIRNGWPTPVESREYIGAQVRSALDRVKHSDEPADMRHAIRLSRLVILMERDDMRAAAGLPLRPPKGQRA